MSPTVINCTAITVLRKLFKDLKILTMRKRNSHLRYGDDFVLLAKGETVVQGSLIDSILICAVGWK